MSQGEWGDVVNTGFLFLSKKWWSDFKFLSTANISFLSSNQQSKTPKHLFNCHIVKVLHFCLKNDD